MRQSVEQKSDAIHRLENISGMGVAQDHEILTISGWKQMDQITLEDKIYTLNSETNKIEIQKPDQVWFYEYQGRMYKVRTKYVSQLVTENHLLHAARRSGGKQEWVWGMYKVKDLYGKNYKIKRDGVWLGTEVEYFTIPGTNGFNESRNAPTKFRMDDWLEFLGYYIAEGSSARNGKYGYKIQLAKSQKANPEIYQRMCYCLKRMGFNSYKGKLMIRFNHKVLCKYLRGFGLAGDKYLPRELFELPVRQLKILFEALISCDGTSNSGNPASYFTISKQLADDFQCLLLQIGRSGSISLDPRREFVRNGRKYQCRGVYRIGILSQKNTPEVNHFPQKIRQHWVKYEGPVYCLKIKNHVFYTRRNGIPSWTGSC